jgi:hypothetical protein
MPPRRQVHLVCVIGGSEVSLLPHQIEHYRRLGIESFSLIRHAESAREPSFHRVERYAREAGIRLFHSHVAPWEDDINQRLVRYAMDEHPDDWHVVVDSDEFQVYDRPLAAMIEACERGGYDHATGALLDRVGPGGSFPAVTGESIWAQFPLAGSISAGLIRALPLKAVLAHGSAELLFGQHGVPDGAALPDVHVQVHHFKWTATALSQLRDRLERHEQGRWHPHPAVIRETRRFLQHVDRAGGRIDCTEPRLKVAPAGGRYTDYPWWSEVVREAAGWQWTLR